jgi:hypothetical protein
VLQLTNSVTLTIHSLQGKMRKSKSAVKIRKRWKINPKTRVEESSKRYSRAKVKKNTRKAVKNAIEKGA